MQKSSAKLLNNPYGQATFDLFRHDQRAFADKSLMIKNLDDPAMSRYPVLLRPRRFGKSTFVRMLKCYYDLSYKDRYDELFSGTKIYEENLESHNSYHVIDIDFSSVSTNSRKNLVNSFFIAITDSIDDFKLRYPDFEFDYSDLDKSDSAVLLTEFTKAYRKYAQKQNLYLLIDEYDNFANEILSSNLELFQNIISQDGFLKSFYSAVKNQANKTIAKTFITGVSSVSLDSLTSGFNIADNVTDDKCFNEYAGFTEEELKDLIPQLVDVKALGVSVKEIIDRMKNVYDGYLFSPEAKHTVFNSSMCLYYLNKVKKKRKFLNPEDYLDPACDRDGYKLDQIFKLTQKDIVDDIIDTYLRDDVFYLKKLSQNINLNKADEYYQEQVLSILYYLGYLTINKINKEGSSDDELNLTVPNRYMSQLFRQCTINLKLKKNISFSKPEINLEPLLNNKTDISSFADSCTEFLSSIMNNQILLHMNENALNLALYAKLSNPKNNCIVEMEKALKICGKGEKFADLVIIVNKNKTNECIYLFELKYLTRTEASAKDNENNLKQLISKASLQVSEYKNAMDFKDKDVKAYVMIFAGPECIYCKMQ